MFVDSSCRASSAISDEKFDAATLTASDAAEIVAALLEMSQPPEQMEFDGDGVSHPIVYTLKHPIPLSSDNTLTQIEFVAKKVGELSSFLNAQGEVESFREFVRSFGTLLGVKMPVTDSLVDAFDIEDYSIIKAHVMGKLVTARGRLKRVS